MLNSGIPRGKIINAIIILQHYWAEILQSGEFKRHFESRADELAFLEKYIASIMAGKLAPQNTTKIVNLTIDILKALGDYAQSPQFQLKKFFQIEFLPGTMVQESCLVDGILIAKEPTNLSRIPDNGIINPKILLIRQKLYFDMPDGGESAPSGFHMAIELHTPEKRQEFIEFNRKTAQKWFTAIAIHQPNVVITEKGLDDRLESLLSTNGILVIRRARAEQIQYLAQYLQIELIDNVDDINQSHIGVADRLIRLKLGRDHQVVITKQNPILSKVEFAVDDNRKRKIPPVGTILIGGSLWYICQEIERILYKTLQAGIEFQKDNQAFLGGGNLEIFISSILRSKSEKVGSVEGFILQEFSDTFLAIPALLLNSCGLDPTVEIPKMRADFYLGKKGLGVSVDIGSIANMEEQGIYDNYQAKSYQYSMLFECLLQITRIDQTISKRRRV
jgi:T-complex protein 1 subunit gamma